MLKNKTLEGKKAEGPTEKIEVIKKNERCKDTEAGKMAAHPWETETGRTEKRIPRCGRQTRRQMRLVFFQWRSTSFVLRGDKRGSFMCDERKELGRMRAPAWETWRLIETPALWLPVDTRRQEGIDYETGASHTCVMALLQSPCEMTEKLLLPAKKRDVLSDVLGPVLWRLLFKDERGSFGASGLQRIRVKFHVEQKFQFFSRNVQSEVTS